MKLTERALQSIDIVQKYYQSILPHYGPNAASYTFWKFGSMEYYLIDYALDTLYNRSSVHNHRSLIEAGYATN